MQVEGQAVRAELPEIYIPLYTQRIESTKFRSNKVEKVEDEIREPKDIEALMGEHPYLLIQGEAGSGKTTLLKHTALCLAQNRYKDFPDKNLFGWLPILIFLKDLKDLFEFNPKQSHSIKVEDILQYYAKKIDDVLPLEVIQRFIKARQVIFLLDGLDEMKPDHRKELFNAFALFKNKEEAEKRDEIKQEDKELMNIYTFDKNKKETEKKEETKLNKIVFSSRPHGITSVVRNNFGQYNVTILPLSQQQVEFFIKRWFDHIYVASTGMANKTAEAMISEVRVHPSIDQLIESPLLLTAICILYYGGKTLPGQRAELYALFINNLLYRRFDEPEKVRDCLSTLAFRMFIQQTRVADQTFVMEVLKDNYSKKQEESYREYCRRLKNLFEEMEPRCGLLLRNQGEYTFRHLTFQEFLTTLYIVENHTDYIKAIENYWSDPRYEEVIELYVGYLSIQNRSWANKIVKKALDRKDNKTFFRWRLASRSLLDIHPKRRDLNVVDQATKKLQEIFDSNAASIHMSDAGETIGRLGDRRDLECFILVAGGSYTFDQGRVDIEPFEISEYIVTNHWFAKFIDSGGYENEDFWDTEGWQLLHIGEKISFPMFWHKWRWNCPNTPVVGVSWYEACAFCNWLTIHRKDNYTYKLPTEAQWEAAAAGFEKREYPWGRWQKDRCNTIETGIKKTSSVGIFKYGTTAEGVADMVGNVWEWIDRKYDKEAYVLRGGSWGSNRYSVRCDFRHSNTPYARVNDIGFRCVRTK